MAGGARCTAHQSLCRPRPKPPRFWPRSASDETAPEEARVSALVVSPSDQLNSPNSLRPMLEKAVMPDASPRLRTAALPLYARLIDPAKVAELALTASKGPAFEPG